ncbi:hypothetical protein SLS56_001191 [Neofusicoccum ribis]|uniref:Lysine decarboxylase-like protein n=1 Tax=Neofusicoccum ribis TaxID=45134 RepID=A0ABR3TAK4_9PEZI
MATEYGADTTTTNGTRDKRPVVCVLCGASSGTSPLHLEAARALAHALHKNGMKLVYGGGTIGLMGEVARAMVSLAGKDAVHGIIPRIMVKQEAGAAKSHNDESQIIAPDGKLKPWTASGPRNVLDENIYGRTTIVDDIFTRKRMMAEEVANGGPGGGFVALSGGWGTFEELVEVLTWNQLGVHDRGIVVYNIENFWDHLLKWVDTSVRTGFMHSEDSQILVEACSAEEVIERLRNYKTNESRFKLNWTQI